jgi:hypothetical protein
MSADEPVTIRAECYAGHRGEETPRVIVMGDLRIELVEILDRWLAPDHRYFKGVDTHGDIYIVRQDVAQDRWELTRYERGRR